MGVWACGIVTRRRGERGGERVGGWELAPERSGGVGAGECIHEVTPRNTKAEFFTAEDAGDAEGLA